MPQHNFRHNNARKHHQKPKEDHSNAPQDDDNPIMKAFRGYANELDRKHDRHERIVKLSRDITIEAKRIIFLLHCIDGRKNNKAKVLEEAQSRLNKVIELNFKAVAKELQGQDPYQFRWAYSPGLQEFIEAYSFMEYLKSGDCEGAQEGLVKEDGAGGGTLSDWQALQQCMQYEEEVQQEAATLKDKEVEEKDKPTEELVAMEPRKFEFFVDPTEYILGVSDLTGELMRRCINSLGSGETNICMETCKVLQHFYTGYISLNVQRCRELSRKIHTMRQSVLKAENVCYNVKVRGGEAAKWGAVFDCKTAAADDADEGFY